MKISNTGRTAQLLRGVNNPLFHAARVRSILNMRQEPPPEAFRARSHKPTKIDSSKSPRVTRALAKRENISIHQRFQNPIFQIVPRESIGKKIQGIAKELADKSSVLSQH